MNVLEKILEEIDNRKSYHEEKLYQQNDYEIQKMYCDEELDWITNIIRSHMDKSLNNEKCFGNNHAFVVKNMTAEQFKELTKNQKSFKEMERFNRNKGCMVYEVDSNAMEDAKPVSREFLEECEEVARKYKKNAEDNNKCSDCSRRKWYQIGYRDGKNEVENDGWIPVEERLPSEFDEDGDGIITVETTSVLENGERATFIDDYDLNTKEFLTPYKVVAWRKRPEPYKPKKQD